MNKINIIKTLWFNFKMFPLSQAIKFPILLYGKINFNRLSGKIKLESPICRRMMMIGAHGSEMFSNTTCTIDIAGKVVIKGKDIRLGCGSLIRVEKNGQIIFYENSIIGANSMVFSETEIVIHENVITSWNCQIMDTDTHSIKDLLTNKIMPRTKPVIINKNCWIGNHVIINKGTILPNGTIVCANSLCNKNYNHLANIQTNILIGGIPAKIISTNKQRLYDKL